jgi:outer membrane protein
MSMLRGVVKTIGLVVAIAAASTAFAQSTIAVIDVQRVVTESDPGKEALAGLKVLQDQKIEEGRGLQQELDALRDQLNKQQFTLSEEKLEELGKQIQSKGIALQRFQDDAQRELDEARRKVLSGLEERIMPIIDDVGKEKGLSLIFNKFQSGLVYAAESVDITDEVIRRFNTAP